MNGNIYEYENLKKKPSLGRLVISVIIIMNKHDSE